MEDDDVSSQSSETQESSSEDGSPAPKPASKTPRKASPDSAPKKKQLKGKSPTPSNGSTDKIVPSEDNQLLSADGLTPAASSSASAHDDVGSDVSTDDDEPPMFDWMNCEAPPSPVKNKENSVRYIRTSKSVWEGQESSEYIAVRGRESTNRQINGIYRRQPDGSYRKETHCEMDYIYLFPTKNHWRFAATTTSEFSYAYGMNTADIPQRVHSPWLVFDPDTKEFVEDIDIRIMAIKDSQKDDFEVERRRKLQDREKALITTLALRGKKAHEIAVLTQLNTETVEQVFQAANHAKLLLKNSGVNVSGQEEPPLKRKEKEDLEKELKKLGKSTKEIDFALSTFLSEKDKDRAAKQADFLKVVRAIIRMNSPPKEPKVVKTAPVADAEEDGVKKDDDVVMTDAHNKDDASSVE